MIIFGLGLWLIGLILVFVRRRQIQKTFSIQSARSTTAAELTTMAQSIAAEIGGGNWRDYVKLWGDIVADTPLHSEHQHEPCVYYSAKVMREYTAIETTRSKDGSLKTERQRKSEIITNNQRSVPFLLRDRTGTVAINPEGADIETVTVLNEFRPQRSGETLGYRYQEAILPVGRSALVVGTVSDGTGTVVIGKPLESSHQYVISLKDEESLTAAIARRAMMCWYAMWACFGLGGLLILIEILN